MTSLRASLIIKNALNKLDSKDYPNIELWKMEEAVNIAASEFFRERYEAKESNLKFLEDLQVLLKPTRLAGSDKGIYFLSHRLPSDYFGYSVVTPICSKNSCQGVRIKSELAESSNVDDLLQDYSSSPSFEFEQAFHTIEGNKIKVFHNKEFEVAELDLIYYKKPQYITFPNTPQIDGGVGKDMEWEFKEDVALLIIKKAVKILSDNTDNVNRSQLAAQDLAKN
jgi:hypothetical protein